MPLAAAALPLATPPDPSGDPLGTLAHAERLAYLLLPGFTARMWRARHPAGQSWEGFTQAVDELVLVLEGAMEIEVGGRVVRPVIGEELIPAGARHSARYVGRHDGPLALRLSQPLTNPRDC